MNDDGIKEFQIIVWTAELIDECAPTDGIATELVLLAASYGPPKNITTD